MSLSCVSNRPWGIEKAAAAVCVAIATGACLSAPEVDRTSQSLARPPNELIDEDGMRWQLSQPKVTFAKESESPGPISDSISVEERELREEQGARLSELAVSEVAARIGPRMLVGDAEYVLSKTDLMQFAQKMIDVAKLGAEVSARASYPDGSTPPLAPVPDPRFPHDVIDGDDRVQANNVAGSWPFLMIANMTVGNVCTVSKAINHHTAVTAAHCVHNGTNWLSPHTIRFAAGATNPYPALVNGCYNTTIPGGWDSGKPLSYDYAALALRGRNGAYCNYNDYNVGYFGHRAVGSCTTGIVTRLHGYPAKTDVEGHAPGGNWTYPTLFGSLEDDSYTSCPTYPDTLWFNNDASGGQSGSAVYTSSPNFSNHEIRAIYKGGYDGVFGHSNRGRRMDSTVIGFFTQFAGF